jgi:hypothetical protein
MQSENYLVVHHAVYHQRAGHQPQGMNGKGTHRFIRFLDSGQQSYLVDDMRIGSEWTSLPLGMMESVGMVDMTNHGGPRRDTIPTAAEEAEMAACILEVSLRPRCECDVEVRPGECVSLPLSRPTVLLRSKSGEPLRVSFSVYPR